MDKANMNIPHYADFIHLEREDGYSVGVIDVKKEDLEGRIKHCIADEFCTSIDSVDIHGYSFSTISMKGSITVSFICDEGEERETHVLSITVTTVY